MRENIKYMLKNWIAWDKKSPVYFLIRVPALVFQPIVTAYIPKAMIDCIEKGVTTRQLILVVALLSLLLTITIWLDPFMKELILGGARIVRMRYAVAAFEKNLSTDYANIENLEMREKQKRAEVFYNGRYAGGSNFISTLNLFFVAVVGVVASGVLIYKINIWMILLIIATCGAQFCLQRALTKKQRQNLDQRTEPAAKFDYFYKLCKDGTAARIFSFTIWAIILFGRLPPPFAGLKKSMPGIPTPAYRLMALPLCSAPCARPLPTFTLRI